MVSRMENIQNIIQVVLSILVKSMIWRDHNFKYGPYSVPEVKKLSLKDVRKVYDTWRNVQDTVWI